MKLSFAALATLVTLGLSVSAAPAPQDAAAVPADLPALPFINRGSSFADLNKQTAIGATAFGEAFDDESTLPDRFRVNRIIVMAGERIDQVQVNLSGPNGDINNIHGGPGGSSRTTIDLAAGERVTNLKIWLVEEFAGIAGLAMTTTGGRTFNSGTQDGPPDADHNAPPSPIALTGLIGFHGSVADNEVVAIGPIWGTILTDPPQL